MSKKTNKKQGFTLIELAVVMVIIGLLMSGVIAFYEHYLINKRQEEFTRTLNSVTSALAYYIQDEGLIMVPTGVADNPATPTVNESVAVQADVAGTAGVNESADPVRFPCPAGPSLGPGEAGFGVEQRSTATGLCTATNGVTIRTNAAGQNVYVGSIPVTTLALSSKHMLDPYGHRLSYAVSESVSSSVWAPGALGGALAGTNAPLGAITVNVYDGSGAIAATRNNVPFIVVAHGDNGIGAYNVDGSFVRDCEADTDTRDSENCDNDTVFSDAALFQVTADNNLEYDDTIVFSLKGIADKEDYWGLGEDTQDIRNLNARRVGIGNGVIGALNPRGQLDIMGERSLVVGNTNTTNVGLQGAVQAGSALAGDGFFEAPWIYTNGCIEGGVKDASQSAMCLGGGVEANGISGPNEVNFTTAGQLRMHIRGTGPAPDGADVRVYGNVTARTFLHVSDMRLKKDIEDIDEETLKKILLTRIVTFNMIDTPGEHKKIGVIAQELEKIYPDLVYKDDRGYRSVDYVGLIGPLVKGLQQVHAEKERDVKKLNGEIKKLNSDLDDLRKRLDALEGTKKEDVSDKDK